MLDNITRFFDAWKINDDKLRLKQIASSVTDTVQYDDPRTPDTIKGIGPLNHYVGMFSENAPGWSANVTKMDTISGVTRVTVSFAGTGPDGSEQVQLGQYFIEKEGNLITRMIGFVGIGE